VHQCSHLRPLKPVAVPLPVAHEAAGSLHADRVAALLPVVVTARPIVPQSLPTGRLDATLLSSLLAVTGARVLQSQQVQQSAL
jgi:hypothetical protein